MGCTVRFIRHHAEQKVTEFEVHASEGQNAKSQSLFMRTVTAEYFNCTNSNKHSTDNIARRCGDLKPAHGLLHCIWMSSSGDISNRPRPDLTSFQGNTADLIRKAPSPVVHWALLIEDLSHTGFLSNCTRLVKYVGRNWICKSPEGWIKARIQSFLKELEVLYYLPFHPNILGRPDYLVVRDTQLIGMLHPYYKNGNLREFIISLRGRKRQHRVDINFFLFMWAVQLSDALLHLRKNGRQYRNLEAKNLVAKDDGDLLLIDLDLSAMFSPYLNPPEFRNGEVPAWTPEHSTVWSLSAVLWQLSQIVPDDQYPEQRLYRGAEFKQTTHSEFKSLVRQGLHDVPEQRPTLAAIAEQWQDGKRRYCKTNTPC